MTPDATPPAEPAGPHVALAAPTAEQRAALIGEIERLPDRLRSRVQPLTEQQLDTRYRSWTVRQIVHHLADSHVNSYVRFKWALTEDRPTIKAYDETAWAALPDTRTGDVRLPLALLVALHARWVLLLHTMSADDFSRTFVHPETGQTLSLITTLGYYAWHGRHHAAQIDWLAGVHGW